MCKIVQYQINGDIIIFDDSFVGWSFSIPRRHEAYQMIWTRDMIEDIRNLKGFDYEEYEKLINKVNIWNG